MAAWRRAIELSLGDADTAKLRSIAQSRTEPASRVERALILLAYREDPSFFAVGSPEGRIVIRWDVDDRQTPKKFRLSWHEQGGPPVNPPTHQGFGHRVLSHMAQGSSDTGVRLMFAPEGVAWSLECEAQLCCGTD